MIDMLELEHALEAYERQDGEPSGERRRPRHGGWDPFSSGPPSVGRGQKNPEHIFTPNVRHPSPWAGSPTANTMRAADTPIV